MSLLSDKRYDTTLFIFRRDLRISDNAGLNAALRASSRVLPCFIFDPRQTEPHPYRSLPALQFMLEALDDLHDSLREQGARLHCFRGLPQDVLRRLGRQQKIDAVYVNRDYTPFSRQRDALLASACLEMGMDFHSHADALLHEPEQILNQSGQPYRVFTAFYHRSRQIAVSLPHDRPPGSFAQLPEAGSEVLTDACKPGINLPVPAGRTAALALLAGIGRHQHYQTVRDYPALSATSGLSAHLKFGCCSVREAHQAISATLGNDHALLRQLFWRDFFCHVAWHFPEVFGHAFQRRFAAITWRNDPAEFLAWTQGRTGFPLVDAGMRQLRQTGCLPNRVRMLTAAFLVKDLQIDWRWGERHFAGHLLDYDPCLNNGNWQWAASTGCDAQPYFRIFNPWLQQRKFDPDCLYIKQWLPELRHFSPAIIHQWQKKPLAGAYPPAIIDHASRSRQTKSLYLQQPET